MAGDPGIFGVLERMHPGRGTRIGVAIAGVAAIVLIVVLALEGLGDLIARVQPQVEQLLSKTRINPDWAQAISALSVGVLVGGVIAFLRTSFERMDRRLTMTDRAARLGLDAGKFALDDAQALRHDLEEIGNRLERIEKKVGLNVPDLMPQFMKDVFKELEGKSPIAYRYTGRPSGEYYHGIPARDLTEEDYAGLSAENQQLVDHGKLYSRVGRG